MIRRHVHPLGRAYRLVDEETGRFATVVIPRPRRFLVHVVGRDVQRTIRRRPVLRTADGLTPINRGLAAWMLRIAGWGDATTTGSIGADCDPSD